MHSQPLSEEQEIGRLLAVAECLELPRHTFATALIYRRICALKNSELDRQTLGAACLHLACKQTEVARKLRDIINSVQFVWSGSVLEIDTKFWGIKASVTEMEMRILRILEFNTVYDLPYTFLALDFESSQRVAQAAWTWINDLMLLPPIIDLLVADNRPTAKSLAAAALIFAREGFHPKSQRLPSNACFTLAIDSLLAHKHSNNH